MRWYENLGKAWKDAILEGLLEKVTFGAGGCKNSSMVEHLPSMLEAGV